MCVKNLCFTVNKLVCAIKEFSDVTTIVLFHCECAAGMEMFIVINIKNLIIKNHQFLLFVENSLFKLL